MARHAAIHSRQMAVAGGASHAGGNGAIQPLIEHATQSLRQYGKKAKVVLERAHHTSPAQVQKMISAYVRENPGRTIAAAAVAGLLVGFYLRRR